MSAHGAATASGNRGAAHGGGEGEARVRAEWHIITCEYPPAVGGVSDHTRVVAEGLARAGDLVHVWCPRVRGGRAAEAGSVGADGTPPAGTEGPGATGEVGALGVVVHRVFDAFSPRELRRAGHLLDARPAPRRLLVQYVPHGYGYRTMNVAFCVWLLARACVAGDLVEVVVHEPYLEFAGAGARRGRRLVVAAAHRLMAVTLLAASRRVWVTTPAWEHLWRPYACGRRVPFGWLPVPSTVGVSGDKARARAARACYTGGVDELLIGHLGTYPRPVAEQLEAALPVLLEERPDASSLLLGCGGEAVRDRIVAAHPELSSRVAASGLLSEEELSAHLSACDLLLQPFPDGVSSRRTSVVAGLAHGLPVVTTAGRFTEQLWRESRAVALAPAGDPSGLAREAARLLADGAERARLAGAARELYRERFDPAHAIAALRGESGGTGGVN